MRNLTVKREKAFVGCLGKTKLYIEDPLGGDTTINGMLCRKLGDMKNGEEKTFQIGDNAAKVYMIADKLSKNYCNDFYQIAEGEEDVFLSGKCKYNPATGNAFRFNNNDNEDALSNRKRGVKKGVVVLIIAFIVGVVIGVAKNFITFSETFSYEEMSITLTSDFTKVDSDDFEAAYASDNMAVFVLKEAFSLVAGFDKYTLDDYTNLVKKSNGYSSAITKRENGLTFFKYEATNPETNEEHVYYTYTYKSDEAFWIVQFAVEKSEAAKYYEEIVEYAKSVTFS